MQQASIEEPLLWLDLLCLQPADTSYHPPSEEPEAQPEAELPVEVDKDQACLDPLLLGSSSLPSFALETVPTEAIVDNTPTLSLESYCQWNPVEMIGQYHEQRCHATCT
jgi:hypothetical protein